MHPRILIVNGPNLNKLGEREPEIYGHETLAEINAKCSVMGKSIGLEVENWQSNHEGEIVSKIQEAGRDFRGLIINGGAYTHTSIAIMDALLSLKIPVIEVHLSNPLRRDEFRHVSYIGKAATGSICGFGSQSYLLALSAMADMVKRK